MSWYGKWLATEMAESCRIFRKSKRGAGKTIDQLLKDNKEFWRSIFWIMADQKASEYEAVERMDAFVMLDLYDKKNE